MTQPRYQRFIALSKSDNARAENLQKKGIRIVDIFRAGMEEMEKKEKGETDEKKK